MYAIVNKQTRVVVFSESAMPPDGAYDQDIFDVIETEADMFGMVIPAPTSQEQFQTEMNKLDMWWDSQFQATAKLPRAWSFIIKYLLCDSWDASKMELMMTIQHPAIAEFEAYKEVGVTQIQVAQDVTLPVTNPDELVTVWKVLAGQWLYSMFGSLEYNYRIKALALEQKYALKPPHGDD